MAKSDFDIFGAGGLAVIEDGGSYRLQLMGIKYCLYNGRSDFVNSEVIFDLKLYAQSANCRAGAVLRSDATADDCYRLDCRAYNPRLYYVWRVNNGVPTQLAFAYGNHIYNIYEKTRFRIDDWQLSVEEWINGAWELVLAIEDTSHAHAQGYAGLAGLSATPTYWGQFDNLEIGERV